jgi:hypothetical protein
MEKIGRCLYRYTLSSVYYGLIKADGKQIRRSFENTGLPHARRDPRCDSGLRITAFVAL